MRGLRVRTTLTNPKTKAIAIATVVVIADQITKLWAVGALSDRDISIIEGIVRLRLTENPGSAFSLFQNAGMWLGLAAIGASFLILSTIGNSEHLGEFLGMSLILGGAIGNFVDRVVRGDGFLDGAVVDFIDFTRWPTFNIADSAITIGAGLLVWAAIRNR